MEEKDAKDLRNEAGDFVNLGTGKEVTIRELADIIRRVVYEDAPSRTCEISWDTAKPNGTPRKLCDVSKINTLGWQAKVSVEEGVKISYQDFLHGDVRK